MLNKYNFCWFILSILLLSSCSNTPKPDSSSTQNTSLVGSETNPTVTSNSSDAQSIPETLKFNLEPSLIYDPSHADVYASHRIITPGRVVAIGDLHGDFQGTLKAFRLAGAIDENNNWIGKNLVIIQTGDQIDRGNEDRSVLDFMDEIDQKAKSQGGRVISLNGNHEFINVLQHFKHVTRESFDQFLGLFPDLRNNGYVQRATAFQPGQIYAKILAQRPAFIIVNDSVFAHGGILKSHLEEGLVEADQITREWLAGKDSARLSTVVMDRRAGEGVALSRQYSWGEPTSEACEELKEVLQTLSVKRMVVGHTVHSSINSACDDQVWRIDIGISEGFRGYWINDVQPVQVLEIHSDGKVSVLGSNS